MNNLSDISLVVKVDRHLCGFDLKARLISDAIGAFHNNNSMHIKCGTIPLPSMVMPGIVMDSTMPTFYKIPVTAQLVKAIEAGEQPKQETIIHMYHPKVPWPKEGIKLLNNWYIILSCFEVFRWLVFWSLQTRYNMPYSIYLCDLLYLFCIPRMVKILQSFWLQ